MNHCESSEFSPLTIILAQRLNRSRFQSTCNFDFGRILKDYVEREINLLMWVCLIAITALLLRKLAKIVNLWVKGAQIPGPACPSFYGHSQFVNGKNPLRNLTELLSKSHEKYGSIVKLWLGPSQLLVSIKDPSLIKQMLTEAADKLPLTGRVYRQAFGRSRFFVSSFDKVKRGRESLAFEFNGKLLEKANLMTEKVLDCVMERIHSVMTKGGVDCGMVSQYMAFCFLGATLFGDSFLVGSKANIYEDLLMSIAKDACFWASYNVTPFWKRGYWKYQNLCAKLNWLTQEIIYQCQQSYGLLYNGNHKSSVKGQKVASDSPLSAFVAAFENLNSDKCNGHLNPQEELCGNVMAVMFHGCLTTAGLIGNILTMLATHPEIQDKIYSEINMLKRGSKKQKPLDVRKLKLLLATVYESARLLPSGPLLQRRSLKHDLKLENGVTIPAGAVLVTPVELVQMDEAIWGSDAGRFNPYRFLSKAEQTSDLDTCNRFTGTAEGLTDLGQDSYILKDPNENASFLSFGSGARACVGQKFAVLGIASIFASLLERYKIELQPGCEINPKPSMSNCVLQLLPSPKILFIPRET